MHRAPFGVGDSHGSQTTEGSAGCPGPIVPSIAVEMVYTALLRTGGFSGISPHLYSLSHFRIPQPNCSSAHRKYLLSIPIVSLSKVLDRKRDVEYYHPDINPLPTSGPWDGEIQPRPEYDDAHEDPIVDLVRRRSEGVK